MLEEPYDLNLLLPIFFRSPWHFTLPLDYEKGSSHIQLICVLSYNKYTSGVIVSLKVPSFFQDPQFSLGEGTTQATHIAIKVNASCKGESHSLLLEVISSLFEFFIILSFGRLVMQKLWTDLKGVCR